MRISRNVRAIVLSFSFLLIVAGRSLAQEPPASVHPLTVGVVIDGDDELVSRVRSYVSRGLRDLKDVKISDTQPTFVINCVVGRAKVGDTTLGYVMSFVVTSNLKALKYIASDFAKKLDACDGPHPVDGVSLTASCRLTQEVESQHLVTCSIPNLKETCLNQIADFDGKCLEPLRTGSPTTDN
jgi:hypothetical protein